MSLWHTLTVLGFPTEFSVMSPQEMRMGLGYKGCNFFNTGQEESPSEKSRMNLRIGIGLGCKR